MKYTIDGEERDFENLADAMEAMKRSKTQFNAYSVWTPEEGDELLRLLETDMTQEEIADVLKRTVGSISSRKAKLDSESLKNLQEVVKRFPKTISEGVNPFTREILDKNSAWLHPTILKDLKDYFEIDG